MRALLILLSVFLFSCQSMDETKIKELKEEVLQVHDEVMPKMSKLSSTRRDLEALADSLLATDSVKAGDVMTAASDIKAANDGMRSWMQNFEMEPEGSNDEVLQYFEDQKVSISKVKEDMENSLAKGQEILDAENQ